VCVGGLGSGGGDGGWIVYESLKIELLSRQPVLVSNYFNFDICSSFFMPLFLGLAEQERSIGLWYKRVWILSY